MLDSPLPTGRLSRWLFDAVHRRHLVYNQCWEDPAVDRGIRLFEPDRARGHSFYYGGTSGLVALAMK